MDYGTSESERRAPNSAVRLAGIGLGILLLALVVALVGTFVVLRFLSFARPTKQFAIVVDAGSSKTRSTLFEIDTEPAKMAQLEQQIALRIANHPNASSAQLSSQPLNDLIQIKQVGVCNNGPPLATVRSESEAFALIDKCVKQFEVNIEKLHFFSELKSDSLKNSTLANTANKTLSLVSQASSELSRRVNSLTTMFLGATAGMRELQVIYPEQTKQTMSLIDSAISSINVNRTGPYINKRFVGILDGKDEALFSWMSVNFVAGLLKPDHNYAKQSLPENTVDAASNTTGLLGMIELGGASAQIAYQLNGWPENSKPIGNGFADSNVQARTVDVFESHLHLVTRSDLCIGMDQAANRANYLVLRKHFKPGQQPPAADEKVQVEHPCLLTGGKEPFAKSRLVELMKQACLEEPEVSTDDLPAIEERRDWLRYIDSLSEIEFSGTGNFEACSELLDEIVDKQKCESHFRICATKPTLAPPADIPFITVSGYNYALEDINLQKSQIHSLTNQTFEDEVERNFQAGSVDYKSVVEETRKFCSTPLSQLNDTFPEAAKKQFLLLKCLRAIYVRKLITDFYLFNPETTWNQLKFMIFKSLSGDKPLVDTASFGWTLGLLLNDTSTQFEKQIQEDVRLIDNHSVNDTKKTEQPNRKLDVLFHHGALVSSVLGSGILIFLGIFFISLVVLIIVTLFAKVHYRKFYNGNIEMSQA